MRLGPKGSGLFQLKATSRQSSDRFLTTEDGKLFPVASCRKKLSVSEKRGGREFGDDEPRPMTYL
jgi:hypothetical protein